MLKYIQQNPEGNGFMEYFSDEKGNKVRLSFLKNAFSTAPKHVIVICKYGNQWVLTKHKKRGLEFPGGKVEEGETPEVAARREVFEETGGVVDLLTYVAQYEVTGAGGQFVKMFILPN